MKRLLIISPYFPPSNAADMQRVRMSLPYFSELGWNVEVVCVDEQYSDIIKDDLLLQSVPQNQVIHKVRAFNKAWTAKIGLGSLALRSMWFYFKKVNELLKQNKYDLIYFSTTQFPICILGSYWKNRFKIPYVIDMQDPWHSDYYQDKPKSERPPKYWFSYPLNKYLEPIAMKKVDGLISVSPNYIKKLEERYHQIKSIPRTTITFGAYAPDIKIAIANSKNFKSLLDPAYKNVVYIGRGGADMHKAVTSLFKVYKNAKTADPLLFNKLKFYFIGTSYAPAGHGLPTIMPLAEQYGIKENVIETTDRISYYHTLLTLQQADALFVPGSDDPAYTASKVYPYLQSNKPILAIFNANSPVIAILKEYGVKQVCTYDNMPELDQKICDFLTGIVNSGNGTINYNVDAMEKYSAEKMAKAQCELFYTVNERTNMTTDKQS